MNDTIKQLFKLKALCEIASRRERLKAERDERISLLGVSYWVVELEISTLDSGYYLDCFAYKMLYDNFNKSHRYYDSWDTIPHETVMDVFDAERLGKNELAPLKRFIRGVYEHGFKGLNFGSYKRTVTGIDFLDCKTKGA